jgi:hypothetical protein
MIRTVSLWIRSNGKFSKPSYQDNKQTRLKSQGGEYYLRCAGKWFPVGNDPLLALDAKAAKEKLLRAVERGTVPESEALLHPPTEETRLTLGSAINTYLTTGKAAQKDWRKHTRQCYALAQSHSVCRNPLDQSKRCVAAPSVSSYVLLRTSCRNNRHRTQRSKREIA